MRWPDLVQRALARLAARPALVAIPLRRTAEIREVVVPSIGWTLVIARPGDGSENAYLQLDVWAVDLDAAVAIAREIRAALQLRAGATAAGLHFTAEWVDDQVHPDSTEGAAHLSTDFRLEAAR